MVLIITVLPIIKKLSPESRDITENMRLVEDLGLDSLGMFELASSVECIFNIDISEKLQSIVTVGDLIKIIFANNSDIKIEEMKLLPAQKSQKEIKKLKRWLNIISFPYRMEVIGLENINLNDNVIICSNHASFLDGVWILKAMEKNIEIEFQVPKKDIVIDGDEQRLEQVWTNIVSNAIKYTNDGGLITISMKKTSKEVEVSIEDTGIGMSKEVVSHIFERFYREDKARNVEGNGLGLAIVKSIVDLHNGKIDILSQVDVGTVFIVKLPIEKQKFMNRLKL